MPLKQSFFNSGTLPAKNVFNNKDILSSTQILKHRDTLLIVDKKFQYLNEHLKDKPEDFFAKEKLTLIPVRKSVHPLSKTPATSSYKSKVTSTPLRNLNLSLRATPGKPSGIPKLNQTLNKRVTRKNFNSKTPNYYKTLNSGKLQKTLTPNLIWAMNNEQDLITFSPLAQPLMHSPLSIDHEDKVENQPSCTSPTESPVKTARQSKLQESVDSDIGEEEENQSGLDIVEESDEELEKPDEGQPKYVTVRININSSFMANEEKNMATNEELSAEVPFPVYDINEVDNVILQEEESMTTNRELSEVLLYDSNEDDDEIIPETQQAKEASCLKSRDSSVVNIDESFTLHKEKSVTTNEEPSEVLSLSYDINEIDDVINKIKAITINESTEVVNISASESRDTENSKLKLQKTLTPNLIWAMNNEQDLISFSPLAQPLMHLDGESTKEILQNVGDENAINILDKTEYLSLVKPLRKSVRVQASAVDISNNTALNGSTMNQTVSNSSMTDTSLNPSNASAKSVSCHSFSSFKHNKPETSKAGKLEETEIIDVVNISSVDLFPSDAATTSESRASLSERRLSNRTSQMFVDVTCTSTPFQAQATARQSNKGESSPGVCSTNTSRTSRVTKTQRSSRMSVSKKDNEAEHDSITSKSVIKNRSKSLDTPKNTTSSSSRRSSSVTEPKTPLDTSKKLMVQETPYNDSATSKRSHSHSNIVEDSNMSVFRSPILHKKSSIGEKPDTVVDETPKSHLTLNKPQRQQRSPVNRLSNFEGVKKLMNHHSPKNDLRNIPNLRRIMSPKQQKSPVNDLSNLMGVKNLLKTPKQQKQHQGSDCNSLSMHKEELDLNSEVNPVKTRGRKENSSKQTRVSPPKTRSRTAKMKVETSQKEQIENKQAPPKLRGRRAKNVIEETVDNSTARTTRAAAKAQKK